MKNAVYESSVKARAVWCRKTLIYAKQKWWNNTGEENTSIQAAWPHVSGLKALARRRKEDCSVGPARAVSAEQY